MPFQETQLNLRAWRKLHHFRQKDLARAIGITVDSYARIERGNMNPGSATRSMLHRLRHEVDFRISVMGR